MMSARIGDVLQKGENIPIAAVKSSTFLQVVRARAQPSRKDRVADHSVYVLALNILRLSDSAQEKAYTACRDYFVS
jgi:hypothetical protein